MNDQVSFFKWSVQYSIVISLLTLFVIAFGLKVAILSGIAFLEFSTLLFLARRKWTPMGKFGWGNTITLMKCVVLCGALILVDVGQITQTAFGSVIVALVFVDKMDGIVARHFQEVSYFGEIFDSEVDAFSTLASTLILFEMGGQFRWFIVIGFLRYLYIVSIWLANPPVKKEKSSFINRILGVIMSFSFGFLIIFKTPFLTSIAIVSSIAIVWSFLKDFQWLLGTARKSQ